MIDNPFRVYPYRMDEYLNSFEGHHSTDNYYCNGLWFMTLEGAQKYANWWTDTYREYKVVYTRSETEATRGL